MNLQEEIIETLNIYKNNPKYNDIFDYFVLENTFFSLYNCELYLYLRVSTTGQEFGRQLLEVYYWLKKKNLKIYIYNIYCDKFTGKKLGRKDYQSMRNKTKSNDYILISEIARLGRNWDQIKEEWYKLKYQNINVLVMDLDLLSAPLPYETNEALTLEKKFTQENVFNGILYASCKKVEEVSRTTKAGLEKAKIKGTKSGKPIGKPRSQWSSKENFIKTLDYMVTNQVGQAKASLFCHYPIDTFKRDLKSYYTKYNTKDYKEILKKLNKEALKC